MNEPPTMSADRVEVWRGRGVEWRFDALARALGTAAHELRFAQGPHGKPHLVLPPGAPAVCFNGSDSGDLVVLAVARGREVGIDVQRWAAGPSLRALEHYFSAGERALLAGLPPGRRAEARALLWAGKEAALKATGEGITAGLEELKMSPLLDGGPVTLRRAMAGEPLRRDWRVIALELGAGYAGALAAEGAEPFSVVVRDWPPGAGA